MSSANRRRSLERSTLPLGSALSFIFGRLLLLSFPLSPDDDPDLTEDDDLPERRDLWPFPECLPPSPSLPLPSPSPSSLPPPPSPTPTPTPSRPSLKAVLSSSSCSRNSASASASPARCSRYSASYRSRSRLLAAYLAFSSSATFMATSPTRRVVSARWKSL